MANNELSGPIVSMGLINFLEKQKMKIFKIYIYTRNNRINSFFGQNFSKLKKNVIGGYNLSCIGDNRMHSCILSNM